MQLQPRGGASDITQITRNVIRPFDVVVSYESYRVSKSQTLVQLRVVVSYRRRPFQKVVRFFDVAT